eukprot:Nk52_evm43s1810 gene=Nk52_evmTU43s1810
MFFSDLQTQLSSRMKLDRDKGIVVLEKYLVELKEAGQSDEVIEKVNALERFLLDLLSKEETWEICHGALMACKCYFEEYLLPCWIENSASIDGKDDIFNEIASKCVKLLTDKEVRVRNGAGELLGALCKFREKRVYETFIHPFLLPNIIENMERDGEEAKDLHDTAGWKTLETSMKCLEHVMVACESDFVPFIDEQMLGILYTCMKHTNRFVRETSFYIAGSLVNCCSQDDVMKRLASTMVPKLGDGLGDNWSQVRLASSVATRMFLAKLSEEQRESFYPVLLPRMCLNRYYVAEGVRLYNQASWKQFMGTCGRSKVEKYIKEVVEYYIFQTEADNHAVREAACACIAELGLKVQVDAVRPYIGDLLKALLVCFRDESWPVRAASCVACGRFFGCFPEECEPSLAELYKLLFAHIGDNIWSVREDTANALTSIVKAYGKPALDVVMKKMKEDMMSAVQQPSDSKLFGSLGNATTFGVAPSAMGANDMALAKKSRDNDVDLHTNQQMYSCGSLAPKLRRGGGCMDCEHRRPQEPWELSDGYIYLLRGVSENFPEEMLPFVPDVAKLAALRQFTHHYNLLETIWKSLPVIASNVGKKKFKQYLEPFLESIFYSINSDNQLAAHAARMCLVKLAHMIGPSIMKGRVDMLNPNFVAEYENIMATEGNAVTSTKANLGGTSTNAASVACL